MVNSKLNSININLYPPLAPGEGVRGRGLNIRLAII
jgi:hypothetical protein